jgi:CheY-like chemotaxis protein
VARLLIVSRSMALAMRLADQHEVLEHSADDLDGLATALDADVLVLDIGDPIQAVTTVNELRQAGRATPVLLVSGYQKEWEQVEAQKVDGVIVVPLPITRAALLTGIAALTSGDQAGAGDTPDDDLAPDSDEDPAEQQTAPDDESADDEPAAAGATRPDAGLTQPVPQGRSAPAWGSPAETLRVGQPAAGAQAGPDTGSQSTLGPPSRRLPLLGNRPRKLQRRPAIADTQGLGLVTDPLGPRTDPYGFSSTSPATPTSLAQAGSSGASSALDRRLDSEAAAMAGHSAARRSASGIVMRPADLVQSLLDQVGDLYGVSDTAQVLADDVIERADADAAAILVPDGPIWRVSGGVGLRPLERRLILEPSHWLITEIGSAGRAVLIDDTDIIRQQLAGAPLAAWRHLLAVPVPDVRAIVVLARGQEAGPFTDRDLSAVIAPVREAAALLAQAVQTRRLARALGALRETDTEAAPRRRDE